MKPGSADLPPRPIFIVASPRSATSILTWCLGQHSNVKALPETYWMAALSVGAMVSFGVGSSRGEHSALSAFDVPEDDFFARVGTMIDGLTDDYFEKKVAAIRAGLAKRAGEAKAPIALVRRHDDPKQRFADGTPLNVHYIAGLARLFPQAKFIHVLRNPVDVIKSLVKFDRAGGVPREISAACREWEDHVRTCILAEEALGPEKIMRINFEAIEQSPRETIGRCLEFAGEPFEDSCLLPLAQRINSSQVQPDEEILSAEFQNSDVLRQAVEVYEGARAGSFRMAADPEAASKEMETRFAESWKRFPSFVRKR